MCQEGRDKGVWRVGGARQRGRSSHTRVLPQAKHHPLCKGVKFQELSSKDSCKKQSPRPDTDVDMKTRQKGVPGSRWLDGILGGEKQR